MCPLLQVDVCVEKNDTADGLLEVGFDKMLDVHLDMTIKTVLTLLFSVRDKA